MMRGAIDLAHPHRIGGWIYCGLGAVAEQTVLAFVDGECVGAGRVEVVREDLKRAGLGDGKLGFSFPITVNDEADVDRVVVKLEGSDLALLQPGAKLARRDAARPILADSQRIEWLRKKGLLAPFELTFLKCLQQLGAVDQSLVIPRNAAHPHPEIADARAIAQSLFELLALRQVELRETKIAVRGADEIVAAVRAAGEAPLSAFAIHAPRTGALSIVEGSHAAAVRGEGFEGAIDYTFGPDRLLFVDLNARFELQDGELADLTIFAAL